MKLISINIETNRHNDSVLEFLKKENRDVVCFQEFLEDDFELYKKELNLQGVFKASNFVDINFPEIRGKKQGVAIFAKKIVESNFVFYVGKEENALKPFEEYESNKDFQKNNVLLWANIKNDNGEIFKIATTHLPVTEKGESSPYQLKVVDALILELDKLGDFVLCGDMNAPRGNETFRRLNNKYKDNIPLEYKTSIDQNLHRVKGIQLMVDCLFTSSVYSTRDVKLVDGVSDHMAIVAQVSKI